VTLRGRLGNVLVEVQKKKRKTELGRQPILLREAYAPRTRGKGGAGTERRDRRRCVFQTVQILGKRTRVSCSFLDIKRDGEGLVVDRLCSDVVKSVLLLSPIRGGKNFNNSRTSKKKTLERMGSPGNLRMLEHPILRQVKRKGGLWSRAKVLLNTESLQQKRRSASSNKPASRSLPGSKSMAYEYSQLGTEIS